MLVSAATAYQILLVSPTIGGHRDGRNLCALCIRNLELRRRLGRWRYCRVVLTIRYMRKQVKASGGATVTDQSGARAGGGMVGRDKISGSIRDADMSLGVDQRRASAQGDVVGGDKITELHIHESTASSGGVVEQLLRKLEAEIADNAQTQETIQALKRFTTGAQTMASRDSKRS